MFFVGFFCFLFLGGGGGGGTKDLSKKGAFMIAI